MAKASELEIRILQILEKETGGQKITELASALNMDSEDAAVRKSLQRALKSLESQKRVDPKGRARARIYFATKKSDTNIKIETLSAATVLKENMLSKEGEKLLKYISQPINKREPVGYNQKFLENYIPNKTSFLSLNQKKRINDSWSS